MTNKLIFQLILYFFFLGISFPAKTETIIPGGIINKYKKVLSMDGADRVTVSDASDFSIGDTVLIIQMKGIEINVSNDKDFGSELSLSSAGKYEFITITGISGNQIVFSTNLYNTYNPNDDVQLIRVPGFSNNLTVAGTITCEPFDSTSGTGGVVAMIVGNTLTLNADIDASYMGFSGGLAVNGDATCGNTDYFYDAASDKSGFKGEGAASYGPGMVPLGTNYSKGRGPLYQGGGGGNGKHSGGAGGGNYGEGGSGGSVGVYSIQVLFVPLRTSCHLLK